MDGVSFSVAKGQTVGIVGESGSGKSEIGHCLAELAEQAGFKAFVFGQDDQDTLWHCVGNRIEEVFAKVGGVTADEKRSADEPKDH